MSYRFFSSAIRLAALAGMATVAFFPHGAAPALGSTPPLRTTPLDEEAPFRRFLWVTRWDYRNARDIERICYNAASARFTDLLFQVRGEGTVFFQSPYEPWAWELSGRGPESGVGVNPGWDPLEVAVREGRRRGLRVHAYLNVMPAWAQKVDPPAGRGQIYRDKPEWLMLDSRGRRIQPRGFYACVDPGLPEVRSYLANLMGRMAADYQIDGVHLDYIRYPFETGDYSFHPRVTELYEARTGKKADAGDPDWLQFRQDQVSSVVRDINKAVKAARPGIELSAAVIAKTEVGKSKAGQDPMSWIARGDIDAIAPMVYVQDHGSFNEIAEPYMNGPERSQVWLGIWAVEKNRILLDQIEIGAAKQVSGIAVFSYESLFKSHKTTQKAVDVYRSFVSAPPRPRMLEYRAPMSVEDTRAQPAARKPSTSAIAPGTTGGAKRPAPGTKVRVGS